MAIKIALAGNPNSGKTTLFNMLTGSQQYVGNWPGVTVEKKEGYIKTEYIEGEAAPKEVEIIDLPGIYSLSPYTLEEVVSRNCLLHDNPNVIINIIDATNIERNLYLTTQLMELGIPIVIALNMIDEVRKSGEHINLAALAQELGCPVVEISALKGIGIRELVAEAKQQAVGQEPFVSPLRFSEDLEATITAVSPLLPATIPTHQTRWYAVKLLEQDEKVLDDLALTPETIAQIKAQGATLEATYDDDPVSIIIDQRYQFIGKVVKNNITHKALGAVSTSDKIDKIVTNPILALPIFAIVIFLVYYIAISTVGTGLTDWVNDTLFGEIVPGAVEHLFELWNVNPVLSSLVQNGIIAGVGAVLGFLPQMLVLFFLLAILEDCGYMSRIAFIMDKLFRRFGLSGKSFIPMLVSTGCGVPGIMATRTIESERDRKMTIMTTTFVPCSAKLPIIALIAGALFGGSWWVAPSAYFLGIAAIVISGIILKKTKLFAGEAAPFVMELPQYRVPSLKSLLLTVWDKGKSFVIRAGTIIFLSSCIIWFLSNFNWNMHMVETNDSILAVLGGFIAPIFAPLGWGEWRATVATITGLVAKENVVGTFGVLYGFAEVAEDGAEVWANVARSFTALSGYSFLLFNLFCAPCFAAIGAMKKELGTKWMFIAISYMTGFAYLCAFVFYQLGLLITTRVFSLGAALACIVLVVTIYLLVRPNKNSPKYLSQHNGATA